MIEQTKDELMATIRRLEERVKELEGPAVSPRPAAPKTTEQRLLESRRRYEALLGNLPGMVYLCRADENWTMKLVSRGFTKLTGYQPDELIDNRVISFNELIHHEDRERVHQSVIDALAAGQPFQTEYRLLTADGTIKWVWEQGSAVPGTAGEALELEGFITDITERKLAEQALRESEERYRAIAEDIPILLCRFLPGGKISYVNSAYCDYFGMDRTELEGSTFLDLVAEDEREMVMENISRLTVESPVQSHEHRVLLPDGTIRWQQWTNRAMFDDNGQVRAYQSLGIDITERKLARAEQQKADQQLRQAQKMEAVGRLAGGVAHDFNNLLTVIMGYCELMDLELRPDDPLQKSLGEIHEATERAGRLTNQLLAFSRRQVLKPRVIDLNLAITEMEKMLRRLIGEDIDLVVRLQQGLDPVLADPSQVEQVIMNLAVNARDAMPRGGQLTIQTAVEDGSAAADGDGDGAPAESMVVLTVSDTGEGMDPDTSARIFEPFFTTKDAGKGTGLGLSTVYGIVHQSGGEITVESEPGLGTTFRMTFPCHEGAVPKTLTRSSITLEQAGGAETILVLEDNEVLRRLAVRILERCGYSVLEARNGNEARRISAGHDGDIDLLLSDVILPGGSGPETAGTLIAQRPKLRTLFMSGYTDDVILDRGAELGDADLLEKPFTPQSLAHRVRERLRT